VRSEWNDRAGDRRERRHRFGDRPCLGDAGCAGGAVGDPGGGSSGGRARPERSRDPALRPVGLRRGRCAGAAGGGRAREAGYSGQQRRRHARQPRHADEGRRVVGRHPHQPGGGVPSVPRGAQADDAREVRAHRVDHLRGGRDGQSGTGQLRRVQGGAGRHVQGDGAGGGEPEHHGELHRAGVHRVGDDRCLARRAEGGAAGKDTGGRARRGRGRGSGGGVSGEPRGRVRHGANRPCQRGNGDDL
ncbi:MAG: 3-oxoacyl-[acyl-carrier protein] reductase, partial [uncultured Sphingomonadaceae bacterium]